MKLNLLALAAAGVLAISSAASAATTGFTVGVTEGGGNRDLVDGTTLIADAASPNGSKDLGTIGAGDVFGLYGRIVSAIDRYKFGFTATSGFEVNFDFDGYYTDGGNTFVANSGLVKESGSAQKGVIFSLQDANGDELFSTGTLLTNITSGNAFLFGAGAGDYFLVVDGSQGPNRNGAALYDLNISAVPVPAALPLLLTGIAGLGFMSRRRKAA
ncbi:VPLPA-CTERM sorting domain-containing protein [Pikeienuella piscinae]|uniref:VPLPA-CTERM sorting domain-containing protein n=1 Tax=Pikeienuella piscinae TaxID=2748098 RepID=A0A7M3T6I0_9RHOB|nr:VPLPA-CTERM sorting domain-containing protein [Pikeienuella piscinae]QIE57611.1 VPLPA-CTERM sorting domain-containing protein [Pikeienuella piscinae]